MCAHKERDTGLRMAAECHTAPLEAVKGAGWNSHDPA